MTSLRRVPSLVATLAAVACMGTTASGAGELSPDPLMIAVPAAAYDRLDIDGRDGRLDVHASSDETIRARVTLAGGCTDEPRRLRVTENGRRLRLEVVPSTKDRCDEAWTVELPPRLAVRASLDRADVSVGGIEGGVDLDVGNGTLQIDVPRGALQAAVAKGDLMVATGSDSYGLVRLESTVGQVRLSIDGAIVRHSRRPGAGDRLALEGRGPDRISLESTVGDVRLDIVR